MLKSNGIKYVLTAAYMICWVLGTIDMILNIPGAIFGTDACCRVPVFGAPICEAAAAMAEGGRWISYGFPPIHSQGDPISYKRCRRNCL